MEKLLRRPLSLCQVRNIYVYTKLPRNPGRPLELKTYHFYPFVKIGIYFKLPRNPGRPLELKTYQGFAVVCSHIDMTRLKSGESAG